MALIVASLFSVFCMGLFSSCSSDEDDELKVETQLLISLKEGALLVLMEWFMYFQMDFTIQLPLRQVLLGPYKLSVERK